MKSKKIRVIAWSKKLRRSIGSKEYELGWNEDTNKQDLMTYQDLIYRHKEMLDKDWKEKLGVDKFNDLDICYKSEHRAGEKDVQEYQGEKVMKKEMKDEMRGYKQTGEEALKDFCSQLELSMHDYGYEYYPINSNDDYVASQEFSNGAMLNVYITDKASTENTASCNIVYEVVNGEKKERYNWKHIEINCLEAGNRDVLELAQSMAGKLRELAVKVRRTIANKKVGDSVKDANPQYSVNYEIFTSDDNDGEYIDTIHHPDLFDTEKEAMDYIESIGPMNCPYGKDGNYIVIELEYNGHHTDRKYFFKGSSDTNKNHKTTVDIEIYTLYSDGEIVLEDSDTKEFNYYVEAEKYVDGLDEDNSDGYGWRGAYIIVKLNGKVVKSFIIN